MLKNNEYNTKEQIERYIDLNANPIIELSKDIYNNPELAFEEHYASERLSSFLKTYGFEITKPYGSLETAFKANFKIGEKGPHIVVMAEYDALENGHACGHHVIAASGVGAGIAIKKILEENEIPGTISVIGTPAEESGGGKIILLENGAFDGVDAVLLLHPTTGISKIAGRCKSSHTIVGKYKGVLSSAISRPERGINATEGSVAAFQQLGSILRYLPNDVSIMPFITSQNKNNGLLPVESIIEVTITAFEDSSLEQAINATKQVLEGAAIATRTSVGIEEIRGYLGRVLNKTIGGLLHKNMEAFGEEMMEGFVDDNGFEDFGNVNRIIPGAMVYPSFLKEKKVSNHTQEFLELGDTKRAEYVTLLGSKVMAKTALDLFMNQDLLEIAKQELG